MPTRDAVLQFQRYRSAGVIVDSNLLLLFIIGSFDEQLISTFKRTKTYTGSDYRILSEFLSAFSEILVTPNILTEVSNLSNQLPESYKPDYFTQFGEHIGRMQEHFHSSNSLRTHDSFVKFGLADASIHECAEHGRLVLTDDARLADFLGRRGIDVLNFNHIRQL